MSSVPASRSKARVCSPGAGALRRGLLDGHETRSITRWTGAAGDAPGVDLSRRHGHNGAVVRAVIFDFYGTLAHWADTPSQLHRRVRPLGYTPEQAVLDDYFFRYDGVAHADTR